MGAPYHEMKPLILKNGVKAFSSNYTLYGDMSARMMDTLSVFSPDAEIYSVDECFLGMTGFNNFDLYEYGQLLRNTVKQNVGIPCCVGIGPTKTLAKIANRLAKKNPDANGVFIINSEESRINALQRISVDDIWGVGRQYQQKLATKNIETGEQLSKISTEWARVNLGGVVGVRMINELNGQSCIDLEMIAEPKKNIAATRAFGKVVTEQQDISEALSFHIARASEKLRAQNSVAKVITFFFHSNPFSKVYPFFRVTRSIELPVATSDPRKLNAPVQNMLKQTFKNGVRYHKCGVMLQGLVSANGFQADLFSAADTEETSALLSTVDILNKKYGRGTLKFASSGFNNSWMTQANLKSPCYTTNWHDLMRVS